MKKGKITVIGAGNVGATLAYTLVLSDVVTELVLIDINKDKAAGDILDISHGLSFVRPMRLLAGDYNDAAGSEIVIITAGAAQKPDETRLQLVDKNKAIFSGILDNLLKYIDPQTIIMVVTNPVDVLTYFTLNYSGFPKEKVIGSGTVLDTSRFRFLLSQHTGIDVRNVHAYIIGEHGDSEVAVWSSVNVGGMTISEYCAACCKCDGMSKLEVAEQVKNAAYDIIKKKGSTYYAIGLAVSRIVECIVRDEHSVLTVSTLLEGQYDINDVCLSVPAVVTAHGVNKLLELTLSAEELAALQQSAKTLAAH